MTKIVALLALAALAGCAGGVATGRKSDCFGKSKSDGTYILRTNTVSVCTKGGGLADDCNFRPL